MVSSIDEDGSPPHRWASGQYGSPEQVGKVETAEIEIEIAPRSLLGGAHIHEMWSKPLISKGFSDLKQISRKKSL
ncbi:hypothetical protein SAG0097_09010 [Streptococcus agalactiae BSU442]|nr:hypothetical protein SAG0097_02445 [Streptococcus agalactiae BSU442]EPT90743.1 hypothetical protein SAG0097_09010 [Streptococcus agalactiae BSU442]